MFCWGCTVARRDAFNLPMEWLKLCANVWTVAVAGLWAILFLANSWGLLTLKQA
jgi:hypothetical protein